jgi:dTDP-4-amino-4,6-dideoxyglucose
MSSDAATWSLRASPGGQPPPLVVGRPWFPDREELLARIAAVFDSGMLSNHGPRIDELEQRVAELHGVRNCVAVCNGTTAIELALRAAGVTGEVVLPSFTFIATAYAVQRAGLTPVFADVDPSTHNVDVASVERVITPLTSAILAVNLWGRACDVDGLTALAHERGIQLLFDSAHAFGCSYGGRMLGGNGSAETFSFHATKVFHTLEGGAVLTNDDELADRVRHQRSFGLTNSAELVIVGGNAKLNEVSAAVGLAQFSALAERFELNRRRYELYRAELADTVGVTVIEYPAGELSNYHYAVVEVDTDEAGVDRDTVCEHLLAAGVVARPYFDPPCHMLPPYLGRPSGDLDETERLARRTLALPTGPSCSLADIERVCDLVRAAVALPAGRGVRNSLDGLLQKALPGGRAELPAHAVALPRE